MRLSVLLELAAVCLIGIVAVYAIVEAANISSGFRQVLGADQYPRIVASVLLGLCLAYVGVLLVTDSRARRLSEGSYRDAQDGIDSGVKEIPILADFYKAGSRLFIIWILFLTFLLTLNIFGYLLTSFVFLACSIFVLGYNEGGKAWVLPSLFYAALITGALWLALAELLGVYLPQGRIWI